MGFFKIMDYCKILNEAKEIGLGQIDSEWINLMKFLSVVRPNIILEIGTNKGGSAYTLSNFAKYLMCVDIKDICKAKEKISKKCSFDFIVGDSKHVNTINLVEKNLNGRKIDFIFIDGDHSYDGSKNDFNNYVKFLQHGGHVAFHDIVKSNKHIRKNCLVFKFWDEIKSKYHETIEYKSGSDWAGIGIVRI